MRALALILLVVALAFAGAPFVTDFGKGFDPALFPVPQDDPPVQPAGYAFAIWGLIYAWLVIHAAFGLLRRAESRAWNAPRPYLIASLGIGIFWLSVAERSPIGATVMIFAMLALALGALFRTRSRPDHWLLLAPIAIYAGWLSAASFASLGILGAGYGIGPGETGWALLCIAIASILAVLVQWRLGRAPEYGLTVAWALVAIAVKNGAGNMPVTFAAAAGAAAVVVLALTARSDTAA